MRVIARERFLVRPLVALVPQLAQEATLGRPQRLAKDVVPRIPHELEERGGVPLSHGALHVQAIVTHEPDRLSAGAIAVRALELALDIRGEPALQELERFADPFVVGDRHGCSSAIS